MSEERFASTSDERVDAGGVRYTYRRLSEAERFAVDDLKATTDRFIGLCHALGSSRELSNAVTRAQEACMWAVRHVTA